MNPAIPVEGLWSMVSGLYTGKVTAELGFGCQSSASHSFSWPTEALCSPPHLECILNTK